MKEKHLHCPPWGDCSLLLHHCIGDQSMEYFSHGASSDMRVDSEVRFWSVGNGNFDQFEPIHQITISQRCLIGCSKMKVKISRVLKAKKPVIHNYVIAKGLSVFPAKMWRRATLKFIVLNFARRPGTKVAHP